MFEDFSKTQIIIFAILFLGCCVSLSHDYLFLAFLLLLGMIIKMFLVLKTKNIDGNKFPKKINKNEDIC